MSDLGINGQGNVGPANDGARTSRNKTEKQANHKGSVWGKLKENGDNIVNAEDVKIKENASDLQRRAIRDFLGAHNGKQWTEKLINVVNNLFTNNEAIEETMNNDIYSDINIKDENGELYQFSHDNLDDDEQVRSTVINRNEDGSTTKTLRRYGGVGEILSANYDKDGNLVSRKNENNGITANFDQGSDKVTFTRNGEELCYSVKDGNGNRIYYLPDGQEIGDRAALWRYGSESDELHFTRIDMLLNDDAWRL